MLREMVMNNRRLRTTRRDNYPRPPVSIIFLEYFLLLGLIDNYFYFIFLIYFFWSFHPQNSSLWSIPKTIFCLRYYICRYFYSLLLLFGNFWIKKPMKRNKTKTYTRRTRVSATRIPSEQVCVSIADESIQTDSLRLGFLFLFLEKQTSLVWFLPNSQHAPLSRLIRLLITRECVVVRRTWKSFILHQIPLPYSTYCRDHILCRCATCVL